MLDPEKPLVASSAFAAGDVVVSAGEVFDWRARGMTLVEVAPLYASGLLVHPLDPQPAPSLPPPSAAARVNSSDTSPETQTFLVDGEPVPLTAGERVEFPPPPRTDRPHKRRR